MTYKIVRQYYKGGSRCIRKGLTLEQAQAHCNDPETASKTATSIKAKRAEARGDGWFDSFYREN